MKRSLQRRLSLMLGGALLLAALVAGVASFIQAYGEAREFQDDMLRQVALLASAAGSISGQPDAQTGHEGALSDPESRLQVFRLPGIPAPFWYSPDLGSGFHTIAAQEARLRVFVHKDDLGRVSVAAQPTDARDEIALNSALRTLLPLVLLLPIMAILVIRIVRSELAHIHTLARHLDEQPADQPEALPDEQVPEEILPFVQSINRLLGRVNELIGQQRRFVADAAHELRSPLTALSVQAQNLEQARSIEAMRERVAQLRAGIERARKLTEQLLDLARTQAGRSGADELNVSQLARELIADFVPMAEERRIDLGMEESAPLNLCATPEALRLIIRNALENALKYAPAGSQVTLRLYRDGEDAVIDVIDEGPGIPESERTRVFDPFYRMEGTGGEGSGLGLAIAKGAAESLQGKVSLLDGPAKKGLVFRYRQKAYPDSGLTLDR